MKPLIVLLIAFGIATGILRLLNGSFEFPFSARIAMSIMLLFTALGHFLYVDGMALMIPDFIPFKKEMVYITGIIEICGAIGLHIPQFRTLTAWLLIAFFVLALPSNVKAAIEQIDYQKATYNGLGISYLLFRIPLQLMFIVWVYASSIDSNYN